MKHKWLIGLAGLSMLGAFLTPKNMKMVTAGNEDGYLPVENNWQFSHLRRHTSGDLGVSFVGTWHYEEDWTYFFDLDDPSTSFFRLPLNASTAGEHTISFKYLGSDYPIKVYVNGVGKDPITLPGSWAAFSNYDLKVNLNQGKNIVLIQVKNWGGISEYKLSEGLSLLPKLSDENTYYFEDLENYGPYLMGDIQNVDAHMVAAKYKPDNNPAYDSYSLIDFASEDTVKGLELTYKLLTSNSNYGLSFKVGENTAIPLYFEETELNVEHTYTIDKATLTSAGFDFTLGEHNELKFSALDASSESIALVKLEKSSDEHDVFDSKDLSVSEIKEKASIEGRSLEINDEIPLDWTASNVSFIYNGAHTVSATFKATQAAKFVVECDDDVKYVNIPANTTLKAPITGVLENGEHHIRILKSNEANGGIASLTGLTISIDGDIVKPQQKPFKFEFYGSSTVCANQVLSSGVEDGYLGFARLISDAYNAEINTVCVSGRGLQAGYNSEDGWQASHNKQINYLYKYTSYFRNQTAEWDFTKYTPDVLVMNYGNNDLGAAIMKELDFTITDFTNELKRFHHEIREIYPNTAIVYLYGMFKNRGYEKEYRAAVDELKQTDNKVDFVYTPQMGSGADSHPNQYEHEFVAMYLSKAVAKLLNVTNPLDDTYRVEAEDCKIKGKYVKRTSTEDWEQWSNGAYIGNISPEAAISNASEVKMDGSNVKVFEIPVTVEHAGRYAVRVSYSTSGENTQIFYKANNEENFKTLQLKSTNSWATPCTYSNSMYVSLHLGLNRIYVTGTSTNGSWANYDYFQITAVNDSDHCYITYSSSNLYQYSTEVDMVNKGSDFKFKVSLTEYASQFTGTFKVLANGQEINKVNDEYVVTNVQQDIILEVTGITPNTWSIKYYDGETLVKTDTYKVGDVIQVYSLDNKYHLRFDKWDIQMPNLMPNNDLVAHAVFVEDESVGNMEVGTIILIIAGSVALVGAAVGTFFIVRHILKKKKTTPNEVKEDK